MTSGEQVGWEDGRIPFGFQNLVPAGEAFPATVDRRNKIIGRVGSKTRARFFYSNYEKCRTIKPKSGPLNRSTYFY